MSYKKVLVMSTLLMLIVLLGIGTIAYFRRTVSGNVTGQAGNLALIVNGANSIDSETFALKLQRSENFVMPDDKGKFENYVVINPVIVSNSSEMIACS